MVARTLLMILVCFSLICLVIGPEQRRSEQAFHVTVCQLLKEPWRYNHALVEVSGDVLHGFEVFQVYPEHCPEAPNSMGVWLDYGGENSSGTMYCCGVTADRRRSSPLVVEGIGTHLKVDSAFQRFDALVGGEALTRVHATLLGRFFSGRQLRYPKGVWGGYGHMGGFSLLVVEQVRSSQPMVPSVPPPAPEPESRSRRR